MPGSGIVADKDHGHGRKMSRDRAVSNAAFHSVSGKRPLTSGAV